MDRVVANMQQDIPPDDKVIACADDPGLWRIQLRTELSFSLRSSQGQPYVMVHDGLTSRYFRLGVDEWEIAQLLDGSRTLRRVVCDVRERSGAQHSAKSVTQLVQWLVQSGLANKIQGNPSTNSNERSASKAAAVATTATGWWHSPIQQAAKWGRWNPLFLKMELPNPERLLRIVYPGFRFCFDSRFLPVWLAICLAGLWNVAGQRARFTDSLQTVFAAENWICLLMVWVLLKVVHELGHAVACMRFGGRVTRCGLMFIMFSPVAWVDVTSAWNFRSRWQRIAVSGAGMYIEFLIAGIAAICWGNTLDPVWSTITRNVVISASFTTLVFNLNFLMRFDGYYMLSDALDYQNLYQTGQQYIDYVRRRYLLGMNASPPADEGIQRRIACVYGVSSLIWRILFSLGILIAAAHFFRGAGIILAVFSGLVWFGLPLARFALTVVYGTATDQPDRRRISLITASAIAAGSLIMLLPWPGRTVAHGIVEFSPMQTIRADSAGFVERIHVRPGQIVQAGDALLKLTNHELVRELADIRLQLEIATIEQRIHHRDNDMAKYLAGAKKLESLQEQAAQRQAQVDALTVRAPIDGTVIANDIQFLDGKYVEMGDELLSVGSTEQKEIRIAICEEDEDEFRRTVNHAVRIRASCHPLPGDEGTLAAVLPRATRRIPHLGLVASHGGPLAVQSSADDAADDLRLATPHFEAVVSVPRQLSPQLRAGELCRVSVGRGHQRIYEKCWALARSWFAAKSGQSIL